MCLVEHMRPEPGRQHGLDWPVKAQAGRSEQAVQPCKGRQPELTTFIAGKYCTREDVASCASAAHQQSLVRYRAGRCCCPADAGRSAAAALPLRAAAAAAATAAGVAPQAHVASVRQRSGWAVLQVTAVVWRPLLHAAAGGPPPLPSHAPASGAEAGNETTSSVLTLPCKHVELLRAAAIHAIARVQMRSAAMLHPRTPICSPSCTALLCRTTRSWQTRGRAG